MSPFRMVVCGALSALVLLAPCVVGAEEPGPGERVASLAPAPFWSDRHRGWHFYEDPAPEPAPAVPEKRIPPPAPKLVEQRPVELRQFERLQRQLEELRNVAIINPTEDNVRRYMRLEAKVVRQASYFADVAQRVAWTEPDLDMTLQGRPVNSLAIQAYDQEQSQERQAAVTALASTHVLFFFFRSDCPYCHAFAPTLEAFQARYGIRVVAISVDGRALPNFPGFRPDNGIAKTLGVRQVPAVFLAEPFSNRVTPLGAGVLSEAQLLERIASVTSRQMQQMVPQATRSIPLR